jgi:hypothetical protein
MSAEATVVMAGHSRPKDGVASLAYVPAIHALLHVMQSKAWMPGTRPGMTAEFDANEMEIILVSQSRGQ